MSEEQGAVSPSPEDEVGLPSLPSPPAIIRDLPDDQRHELEEWPSELAWD